MRSRLRSTTVLLVTLVGMTLVFSPGCVGGKKTKKKTATELPAEKETSQALSSGSDDSQRADASASPSSGSSSYAKASDSSSYSSSSDTYGSGSSGGSGSSSGADYKDYAGSASGIESSSAAATVGDAGGAEMSLTAGDEPAPEPLPKKKKGAKKAKGKKKKALVADDGDTGSVVPADDAAGDDGGGYTVKRGDTLSKIAKANHVSLGKLLKMNHMTKEDATKLKVGAKLKVASSN